MAEVVHDAQQEFWSPPSVLGAPVQSQLPVRSTQAMAEVCAVCSSEFMIGARFCHSCGLSRPVLPVARTTVHSTHKDGTDISGLWAQSVGWVTARAGSMADAWSGIPFPAWLRYLHFHEIKRGVGLPTAALVAFMIGVGCVAGALGVSFFYKASNLAEFQAIQLWRIEWLLAATASFVAGILLKKPSDDRD